MHLTKKKNFFQPPSSSYCAYLLVQTFILSVMKLRQAVTLLCFVCYQHPISATNGVLGAESQGSRAHESLAETGPVRNIKLNARKLVQKAKLQSPKQRALSASRHPHAGKRVLNLASTSLSNDPNEASPTSSSSYLGTWSSGEWGGCQVNCGTGSRYRIISCLDSAGNSVDSNQCDPNARPTTRQSCEGDCAKCDVNAQFLKGIGANSLISSPIKLPVDTSDVMCLVTNSFSCCSRSVEEQLLVGHYQLRRGLKAQTQHRDTNLERLNDAYNNITTVLNDRTDATNVASDTISAAVDDEPATRSADMESIDLLRASLLNVFNLRTDALATAQSDIAVAQSELQEQLDLMNSLDDDDTPPEDLYTSTASSSSFGADLSDLGSAIFGSDNSAYVTSNFDDSDVGQASGLSLIQHKKHMLGPHNPERAASLLQTGTLNFSDPTLRVFSKACTESVSNFFISLSCAACNPQYPIKGREAPELPVAQVPAATCMNLYSSCSDTLVQAHQHMTEGIRSLLNSHSNLITLIGQVQPILDRVWAELKFDWLPGFSSLNVAKPDLTKMQCVQDLKVFMPYEVSNSTDFCNAYFTFASPKAFLKRISNQIDRGLFAMGKFTSCDRCLHSTLMFLADVLGPTFKGSLRLALPAKAQAMIQSCGAQAPAAALPAGVPPGMAKMTVEERVSSRVRFGLPIESIKGFSFYTNVSQEIVDAASDVPPHEWQNRTLILEAPTDSGDTLRSIPGTRDTLKPMAGGPDAALQVHVMNQNCTKHTECQTQDAPSGVRPWWFCAHPNICTQQQGSCTDEGKALLESGPKCVRGPCGSDLSAIDKSCPVNAICPAQIGSLADKPRPFFGQQYFSKFDLKMRGDDPLGTARGVCDCAFDANGAVTDQCMYARCLAYASLEENTMTCNTGLVSQCLEIKLNQPECFKDDTLSCTSKEIILTYPPDMPGECRISDFVLASDTRASTKTFGGSVGLLTMVLVLIATFNVYM